MPCKMSNAFMDHASQLLGYKACPLTMWSLGSHGILIALMVSVMVRYRGIVFCKYYAKRNTSPKRFCTTTLVPYEALIMFLVLGVPRIMWAKNMVTKALDAGAWEARDFSHPWAWAFIVYFLLIDIWERYHFQHRILVPYYKLKAKRALDVYVAEDIVDNDTEKTPVGKPADEEAATAPPSVDESAEVQRPTITTRVMKLFKVTYPDPTATNVLAQYHIMALTKAIFVFVFLSNAATMSCGDKDAWKGLFNVSSGLTLQFLVLGGFMSIRFVGLLFRGLRFGRREVDFAAVNSREGQLRL